MPLPEWSWSLFPQCCSCARRLQLLPARGHTQCQAVGEGYRHDARMVTMMLQLPPMQLCDNSQLREFTAELMLYNNYTAQPQLNTTSPQSATVPCHQVHRLSLCATVTNVPWFPGRNSALLALLPWTLAYADMRTRFKHTTLST